MNPLTMAVADGSELPEGGPRPHARAAVLASHFILAHPHLAESGRVP